MSENKLDIPLCRQVSDDKPEFYRGSSSKIRVSRSSTHGYGVFAIEDIAEGGLIEEARMLRTGLRRNYNHDPILKDYWWGFNKCTCDECRNHGHVLYLGLGNLSLYNHSDKPNTKQKIDFSREIMTIHARQDIKKGDEIFVNYGEKYWFFRKLWHNLSENARQQLIDHIGE